jgi:hyperosmotically inducible periplasmic protein
MFRRIASLLGIAGFVFVMAACSQSDPGVTTAVKTKLAADDTVKAYKIDVDTKDGVVTLTGTVDTAAAKARAVEVARNTKGVVSVTDQLALAPPATSTSGVSEALTDPAITSAVKTKLLADPFSKGLKIDVDTSNSVVTLKGSVRTTEEKTRAEQIAKETTGVSSVVNELKIEPKKN